MAQLRDLLTVLYRPRETTRRVLEAHDRWAPEVVALAFVCASVNDSDIEALSGLFPSVGLWSEIAIVAFGLLAGAALWVITLYLLSWLAWFAGKKMGGLAPVADVRAALAWGMVPVIWSMVYRIPIGIMARRFHVPPNIDVHAVLIDVAAQGGCSIVVVYLALQLAFAIWSIWIASCNVAEAQQFTTAKGFLTVAIALAVPTVIIVAGIATRHMS